MRHVLVSTLWKSGTHLLASFLVHLNFGAPEFLFFKGPSGSKASDRSFDRGDLVATNPSYFDTNITIKEHLKDIAKRRPGEIMTVLSHHTPDVHGLSNEELEAHFGAVLVAVRKPFDVVLSLVRYFWHRRQDVDKGSLTIQEFALQVAKDHAHKAVNMYCDLVAFARRADNAVLLTFDDLVAETVDFARLSELLGESEEEVRQALHRALEEDSATKLTPSQKASIPSFEDVYPQIREMIERHSFNRAGWMLGGEVA